METESAGKILRMIRPEALKKSGSSFFSVTLFGAFSRKVQGLDVPIRFMDHLEPWTLWRSENWLTSWTFLRYA